MMVPVTEKYCIMNNVIYVEHNKCDVIYGCVIH